MIKTTSFKKMFLNNADAKSASAPATQGIVNSPAYVIANTYVLLKYKGRYESLFDKKFPREERALFLTWGKVIARRAGLEGITDFEGLVKSYMTLDDKFYVDAGHPLDWLQKLPTISRVINKSNGGASNPAAQFIRENPTNTLDAADRALNSNRIDYDLYKAIKAELRK